MLDRATRISSSMLFRDKNDDRIRVEKPIIDQFSRLVAKTTPLVNTLTRPRQSRDTDGERINEEAGGESLELFDCNILWTDSGNVDDK